MLLSTLSNELNNGFCQPLCLLAVRFFYLTNYGYRELKYKRQQTCLEEQGQLIHRFAIGSFILTGISTSKKKQWAKRKHNEMKKTLSLGKQIRFGAGNKVVQAHINNSLKVNILPRGLYIKYNCILYVAGQNILHIWASWVGLKGK